MVYDFQFSSYLYKGILYIYITYMGIYGVNYMKK